MAGLISMKLLIISHTPHYRKGESMVGWGATVRELDALSTLFDQVVHIAPLHDGPPPASALAYQSSRVLIHSVAPAGGTRLIDKLSILNRFSNYAQIISKESGDADVIHVRCPANISLLAIILLACMNKPSKRWIKYAGNWQPKAEEPLSYTFQRWWLKYGLHRGLVTVNGEWPGQPEHIHPFLNPCLTEQEIIEARKLASRKELSIPLRLILVGRLETDKGVGRALIILAKALEKGLSITLDIIGDGPERLKFEKLADELKIRESVKFHGWLARPDLGPLFTQAHIMLFPTSCSEGWPKVLSEGMAYGVVPLAGNVSSIPQYLKKFGTGRAFNFDDLEGFTNALLAYYTHPEVWQRESSNGLKAAKYFSYTNYLRAVQNLLSL